MSEPVGIYDGRDLIGEIVVSGNRVVATRITPSGKRVSLGTYPNGARPWPRYPPRTTARPREATLERPTLECNAGNIDAFQGRKATVVLWRTWRWSALDHSSAPFHDPVGGEPP
jgi:hypothetical protein